MGCFRESHGRRREIGSLFRPFNHATHLIPNLLRRESRMELAHRAFPLHGGMAARTFRRDQIEEDDPEGRASAFSMVMVDRLDPDRRLLPGQRLVSALPLRAR